MKVLRPIPEPTPVSKLGTAIYADGADLAAIRSLAAEPYVKGFTTNPTLMRKAGVTEYRTFAEAALALIGGRPISFEIFADEPTEMERQVRSIASWAPNIYVKVPVSNTTGESMAPLIRRLASDGIKLNVTALFTLTQVEEISQALKDGPDAFISVFAGRIADTGRDPVPLMANALEIMRTYASQKLIWASPRELLNVYHADQIGCHVITVTSDLLAKLQLVGKPLPEYSLETVRMFHDDAMASKFEI